MSSSLRRRAQTRHLFHRLATPVLLGGIISALILGEVQLHDAQVALDKAQNQLNGKVTSNGNAVQFQGKTFAQLQAQGRADTQREIDVINADVAYLQSEVDGLRAAIGEGPAPSPSAVPGPNTPTARAPATATPRPAPRASPSPVASRPPTPVPAVTPAPTLCTIVLPTPPICLLPSPVAVRSAHSPLRHRRLIVSS